MVPSPVEWAGLGPGEGSHRGCSTDGGQKLPGLKRGFADEKTLIPVSRSSHSCVTVFQSSAPTMQSGKVNEAFSGCHQGLEETWERHLQ
jgi:hypothetical protein